VVTGSIARPTADSTRDARAKTPQHTGLFAFVLLILIWAPIPIGSNRVWSMALVQSGMLMLLGFWLVAYAWRPFEMPDAVHRARFQIALLIVWALYPLLQLAPLPSQIVEMMGNSSYGAYARAMDGVPPSVAFLSVDRAATLNGFLWQCSLVAAYFCVLALATSRKRLIVLLTVMFLVGFADALYGLLIYFGGDVLKLWNPGYADGVVSGTYVNQNHFAGLMELTIPIGLGLFLYFQGGRHWRPRTAKLIRPLISLLAGQSGIVLFCVLIMAAALILTTSRGGVGSLAIGIVVAALFAVISKGKRAGELGLGAVAIALTVIALIWIGPGKMSEKLQNSGLTSQRGDLREVSYQIIGDNPLFGTGIGTYRWVFPGYKDERFGGNFYEHAHNDFLELLGEQGFVGATLLVLPVLLILFRIVRAYGETRDPLARGALFAAISGTVAILVHGLVDFNLHIPANALYFVALLGLGSVACKLGPEPHPG
jgi:O-antigen ligase